MVQVVIITGLQKPYSRKLLCSAEYSGIVKKMIEMRRQKQREEVEYFSLIDTQ